MVYQVNANVTALNVYNNLGVHQIKASNALAKISSGLKAAGGVDVASTGAANGLRVSAQATQTAIASVQNAINTLRVADQVYAEAIALAQVGLEVANRAADVNADTDVTDAQLAAITLGITAIMDDSQFNGVAVLTSDPGATVNGAGDAFDATPPATSSAPASDDIAGYEAFLASAVTDRATNAGNLATLQNVLQVLNSTAANELAGMSQAQDADIALEMMNLTSANIMTEAASAMLAQSMQLPNSVLKLLQ